VVPGLDKKGRCVPVKSKMIVQILEEERKTIQDSAKNMGPAFQEKKPEASEMVLDSKVGSVKVFVGDTL
jgi:PAB1-binding protein PBP1